MIFTKVDVFDFTLLSFSLVCYRCALLHTFFGEKKNSPNKTAFAHVHISLCCNAVIFSLNFIHPLCSICGPLRISYKLKKKKKNYSGDSSVFLSYNKEQNCM